MITIELGGGGDWVGTFIQGRRLSLGAPKEENFARTWCENQVLEICLYKRRYGSTVEAQNNPTGSTKTLVVWIKRTISREGYSRENVEEFFPHLL